MTMHVSQITKLIMWNAIKFKNEKGALNPN